MKPRNYWAEIDQVSGCLHEKIKHKKLTCSFLSVFFAYDCKN